MKKKSLVVLALTGLLTASMFYAIPAIADDAMDANSDEPLQVLADNGMQSDAPDGLDANANAANPVMGDASGAVQSTSGNDAGSPDTATGDDDY